MVAQQIVIRIYIADMCTCFFSFIWFNIPAGRQSISIFNLITSARKYIKTYTCISALYRAYNDIVHYSMYGTCRHVHICT